jgi:uncharacterized Fe-S cluster-containing radical SAM superfamily protein
MGQPRVVLLEAGVKTFATGLLPDLITSLRACAPGDLLRISATDSSSIGAELESWCRVTRNSIVEVTRTSAATSWVIRCGELPQSFQPERPVGSRLWLYANFDCNLRCDYCCVRSSPRAPRRALGYERFRRIAAEAADLNVREIFVTGGEPFLLPDIAPSVAACATTAPTTLLTNGMLFSGRRLEALRTLSRNRVTLQISLDSPTPQLHDLHRGQGSWMRAWAGVQIARAKGFRVRIAATVTTDVEEQAFSRFLDESNVMPEDRVIRRIAMRGAAEEGVPIARADLVPEITITAEGVYWHPVGAEDDDLLVTRNIFPLADAFSAVLSAFEQEHRNAHRLASIFNCA